MLTYNIEINEQQMAIIQKAMKNLLRAEEVDQTMSDEDLEELALMVGMANSTRQEEQSDPGCVHSWCY